VCRTVANKAKQVFGCPHECIAGLRRTDIQEAYLGRPPCIFLIEVPLSSRESSSHSHSGKVRFLKLRVLGLKGQGLIEASALVDCCG
jgi:hypothetical protein